MEGQWVICWVCMLGIVGKSACTFESSTEWICLRNKWQIVLLWFYIVWILNGFYAGLSESWCKEGMGNFIAFKILNFYQIRHKNGF